MPRDKQSKGGGKEDRQAAQEDAGEDSDSNNIETTMRRVMKSELAGFKADMEKWFVEKMGAVEKRVNSLESNIVRQTKEVADLRRENADLVKQLADHDHKLEELESYSKCDNLIIRGLPESSTAERASGSPLSAGAISKPLESSRAVELAVIEFCRESLDVNVSSHDISAAHRIRGGGKDKSRPIIVRFASRKVRDEVYSSKMKLKGLADKCFISEHLTKAASELFFEARKMLREKKLVSTWTRNGQVLVRFPSDSTKAPKIIRSRQDLIPSP